MGIERRRSGIDMMECVEQDDGSWECKVGDLHNDEHIDTYHVDSWHVFDEEREIQIGDTLNDHITVSMEDNECGLRDDDTLVCDKNLES